MSKTAVNQSLLRLLVSVYNRSIQSYYYFPDIIICGNRRMEKSDFDLLLQEGLIEGFYADSFGQLFRHSKKAEALLCQFRRTKRKRIACHPMQQYCFAFA